MDSVPQRLSAPCAEKARDRFKFKQRGGYPERGDMLSAEMTERARPGHSNVRLMRRLENENVLTSTQLLRPGTGALRS